MSKLSKATPKDLLIDNNSSINTDIMNFLSIDCSTNIGSLFIKTKNKTFNKILQSDKFHIDLLMKQILDFFKENNLKFEDISQIFVNQGPGNFSGLRGSLAVAKGISLSKNLNLSGYNTFIWSCAKLFNKKESILSIIEFRERYFIKKFDRYLHSKSNIQEITDYKTLKNFENLYKVIPNNAIERFDKKILNLNNLYFADLDHNDLEFLYLKDLLDKELIKPLYLS